MPAEHDGEERLRVRARVQRGRERPELRDAARQRVHHNGRATNAQRQNSNKNDDWWIEVTPSGRSDVTITLAAGAVATSDGRSLTGTNTATVTGPPTYPLRASFSGMPASHDNSSFTFQLEFSEDVEDLSYVTLRDSAFTVTGGTVANASRQRQNQNQDWNIEIDPADNTDVCITLAAGAVTTPDGRSLKNSTSATVTGPAWIAVADAAVDEAEGAVLAFVVSLTKAVTSTVSVSYGTAEGSAVSGSDYTATTGRGASPAARRRRPSRWP